MIADQQVLLPIDSRELPGPDTRTKSEAAATDDWRLKRMLGVAREVGWPMAWTDDLYRHDKQKLDANPGEAFLWILRDTGTHLYPLTCFNWHEAESYRRTIHYWSGHHNLNVIDDPAERARYYVVSNTTLKSLSWQEAMQCFTVQPQTSRCEEN
jgi:hypothetical protein